MKLSQRVMAALLSAVLLLAPAASLAASDIPAGEVTYTAISDDYAGGEQINLSASITLEAAQETVELLASASGMDVESMQTIIGVIASVLSECTLNMSFYDDFGTARIYGELLLGDEPLITAHALIYEDGSVQMMSSLTGQLVLAFPEGTVDSGGSFDIFSLMYGDFDFMNVDESVPFEELPAFERLGITSSEVGVMLFSHLLGWVSATQMDTEELYLFDDTYIEETDTRDAVAQRMIGTIQTQDFTKLLWNIATTLRDDEGLFQQALADSLAEMGVTRYQVRQVVDGLLTEETMSSAEDWVQMSSSVPDDGALCELDDISYAFKRLQKSADRIWHGSTNDIMHMIVSYDDYGSMVGFDADTPLISEYWPFEGTFTYSVKTDEDWQQHYTSHGELQIYDDNRVVGDLSVQKGEDVDGENLSYLNGQLDVINQVSGDSWGVGVAMQLDYVADTDDAGTTTETFDGQAALQLRENGEGSDVLSAYVTGQTAVDGDGFTVSADAGVSGAGFTLDAALSVWRGEYEEIPFAGGEAIDMSDMSDEQLQRLQGEALSALMVLSMRLTEYPGVLDELLPLGLMLLMGQ